MHHAAQMYRAARSTLRPLRSAARDIAGALLRLWVTFQWRRRRAGDAHTLPAPLIVSLTSYPARFPTLALTLKCLLSQSIRPDVVLLWIARTDLDRLPPDVVALTADGLIIRPTADLRSFKKIVPALKAYPDAFIAIADDDVFYHRTWLAQLLDGYVSGRREIPCHRAHLIGLTDKGAPLPYLRWRHDARSSKISALTFATGVGGALYPPGSLHRDTVRQDLFMALCPASDDAWLFWMARLSGWRFRKVGGRKTFIPWPGTQRVALQHENAGGGNDAQIAALVAHYGFPSEPAFSRSALNVPKIATLPTW